MILLVLLYGLLALAFTIGKHALDYTQPCFLIAFRMLIAGSAMLAYILYKNRTLRFIYKKDMLLFLQTALFHIYIAYIGEFWALQFITSSKTTLFYSLTPFISAVLAYFLFKEKFGGYKIFGMILGFIGVCPMLFMQTDMPEFGAELFRISLPEVVLLGAVVSSSYAWFLVKKLMDRGYHLISINGIAMFIGGILALITSIIFEIILPVSQGQSVVVVAEWLPFLQWTFGLILIANVIGYNLYAFLLQRYTVTFVSLAGCLCPLFGAFLAGIF